jgi:hypothetical protein
MQKKLQFMQKILFYIFVFQVFVSLSCKEKSFTIDKNDIGSIAIVIPDTANSIILFAAEELKKHMDLIFGGDLQIYSLSVNNKSDKKIFIGIRPDDFRKRMNPEEAVYVIRKNSIYLFGDDVIDSAYSDEDPGELRNRVNSEVLDLTYNRTGTLFAVYNFLENELNVRWIKPGDQGIFCSPKETSSLKAKESSWTPVLIQRNIRTGMFTKREQIQYGQYAPKEFRMTDSEVIKKQTDVLTWMRRMRMGRSENFRFGHAYTSYWNKYKETNPDIFALNGKGERKPVGRIERVKMCPTNPDLPKIIVEEWKENYQRNPQQNRKSISGCENDGDGFGNDEWCHCDKCMAIDMRKEGEELTSYATDRYVYLWNAILKEARKVKSDIIVTGYAYANMFQPPRRVKLDEGILIEFIPRMGGDFKKTQEMYTGWREAGMKTMMYRPNDMNWEIGIPFGQEERLFSDYKLAISNNAVGTDFDSMLGFWDGISDMTYYVITKGHVDPQASFEKLESEFLDCFGEAKEDISRYYEHWRNIFNNRVMKEELRLNDGIETYFLEWGLLYRITERIDEFYSIADFNLTDSYLKDALTKNISEQAREYIERMLIVNEHSRLTFICFMAGKKGERKEMISRANELIDFRIRNKDKVDINWNVLFQYQHYQMRDQIGTRYLGFLPEELNPDEF